MRVAAGGARNRVEDPQQRRWAAVGDQARGGKAEVISARLYKNGTKCRQRGCAGSRYR